jgi:hypothetical protein
MIFFSLVFYLFYQLIEYKNLSKNKRRQFKNKKYIYIYEVIYLETNFVYFTYTLIIEK